MSAQAVQQFNEKVVNDAALQAKVDTAKSGKEWAAIAADAGYKISHEDLRQFAEKLAKDELADDQLEQVSGGSVMDPSGKQLAGDDIGAVRSGLARRLLVGKAAIDEEVLQPF